MNRASVTVSQVTATDLPAVNALIERAVATWDLPERVKRLALPAYRYDEFDLQTLTLIGAHAGATLIGIAAWEMVSSPAPMVLSLHGLFVDPQWWGRGVGSKLLRAAEEAAREQAAAALTVKAQPGALGFFHRHGFTPSATVTDSGYAHSLRKSLSAHRCK